jgi:hypothetical protein
MWVPSGSGGWRVQPSRDAKGQAQLSEDTGCLIDLDFAAIAKASTVEQVSIDDVSHTLALPFLAIDHLPPDVPIVSQSLPTGTNAGRHVYRHDLESFFWSAWWIVLDADHRNGGVSLIDERLSAWKSNNMGENRRAKRGFLTDDENWSGMISWRLWKHHEHRDLVETFLKSMSQMFDKGYNALAAGGNYETAGGHITYDNFIQLFPIK